MNEGTRNVAPKSVEQLALAERRWLDYAWRIVNCPPEHRQGCFAHGAAGGPGLDGINQLRFPGYLGRDFRGLLCVAHVHREPEKGGVGDTARDREAGRRLLTADEEWRARARSRNSDGAFLEAVRHHYETMFFTWDVWKPFRKLVEEVSFGVSQLAFANLAKCRQRKGPSPEPLIEFCQRDFPMTELVEAIRPRVVLVAVKHGGPGGGLGIRWRSAHSDPYVWAFQRLNKQSAGGRSPSEWWAEVVAELRSRLAV